MIVGPANGGRTARRRRRRRAARRACSSTTGRRRAASRAGRPRRRRRARAVGGFTTAFELVPLSPRRARDFDDYVGEGAEQRTRGFVPKAVLLRRYPLRGRSSSTPPATATRRRRRTIGGRAPTSAPRRRRRHQAQAGGAESGARTRSARTAAARARRRRRRRARRRRRRLGGSLGGAAAPPRRPRRRCACTISTRCAGGAALYTAGCLLRLRHATAAAGGGARSRGLFDDDSDALHLYGAAPDGWGGRNPPEPACCAVLRFGVEGDARVEQLAVAPDRRADGWERRLLDAAEPRAPPQRARAAGAPPPRSPRRACCSSRSATPRPSPVAVEGAGRVDFTAVHSHLTTSSTAALHHDAEGEDTARGAEVLAQLHDHGVHDRRSGANREVKFPRSGLLDKDFANKVKRGERVLVDESGSNGRRRKSPSSSRRVT